MAVFLGWYATGDDSANVCSTSKPNGPFNWLSPGTTGVVTGRLLAAQHAPQGDTSHCAANDFKVSQAKRLKKTKKKRKHLTRLVLRSDQLVQLEQHDASHAVKHTYSDTYSDIVALARVRRQSSATFHRHFPHASASELGLGKNGASSSMGTQSGVDSDRQTPRSSKRSLTSFRNETCPSDEQASSALVTGSRAFPRGMDSLPKPAGGKREVRPSEASGATVY